MSSTEIEYWTDAKGSSVKKLFKKVDGIIIDLRDGDDFLSIVAIGEGGATIDGGTGNDTLDLSNIEQAAVEFYKDFYENPAGVSRESWELNIGSVPFTAALQPYRYLTLLNVETIKFGKGVVARLAKNGVTISGTNNDDVLSLTAYTPVATSIQAGGGNDLIYVAPRAGNDQTYPVHTVDGGAGSDTVFMRALPSAYTISWNQTYWLVRDLLNNPYIVLKNVESAIFDDGSKISLSRDGNLQFRAGATSVHFVGTTQSDQFFISAVAGTPRINTVPEGDFFDFSAGGRDWLYLNTSAYAAGTTTHVTLKGFKADDTVVVNGTTAALSGPDLKINAAGLYIGTFAVHWDNKATTVLHFQT